jgi:hypothetical protein
VGGRLSCVDTDEILGPHRVPSKGEDDPRPCSRAHPHILVKHGPRHPDPAMEKGSLDCSAIAPQRTMGDYQAAE